MGLFDKIFKGHTQNKGTNGFWQTLTAYSPVFTSFGGSIYESELVRAAIHARATHASKLCVSVYGSARPSLQTKLRSGPNEWQTWGQYLYRLSTILDVQNTAFIAPIEDYFGQITGYYPLLPSLCEIVDVGGDPWLRYRFATGDYAAVELSRCGIMTKFQYSDDFFGESNTALAPTMDLISIQNQGIEEGVKAGATYRFMARVGNFSKPEDLARERQRFTRENLESDGGGLLLFPNTYTDIKQIEAKPFVVDADQMKAIKESVYDYFGVSEEVLQNKAYGDSWSAFYEGAIEPFAIQFGDVHTKMTFSMRERVNSGIMATANRLQYMSNADKLNVSAQMADRGLMTRNEIREIWNLPPLPEGIGDQLPVRGEYYNLGDGKDADQT